MTVLLSAAVSFAWGYLIYGGDIKTIWPVFGVANQTIGALALAIGTTMILQRSKKKIYALTTFLPMTFLFITVLDAGITNVFNVYLPQKQMVPAVLVITLMILAIIIMVSSVIKWISILSKTRKAELALENE